MFDHAYSSTLREHRYSLGRKMLVHRVDSGDPHCERHSNWRLWIKGKTRMKKSGWSVVGFVILLLIFKEIFVYVKQNFAVIFGFSAVLFLGFLTFSASARRAQEEQNAKERELSGKILQTSRNDHIRGYKTLSETGWVNVRDCVSTQDVEQKLRAAAAEKGANAVTKLHWKIRNERYQAGRGKKGNPYYRSRTVYDGEGLGVRIEPVSSKKAGVSRRLQVEDTSQEVGYPSGWVALDGNNIFGKIHEQTNDVERSFDIFKTFLLKLTHSPYKPHVFWDGKFIRFAHATDASSRGTNFEKWLQEKLNISAENLTVSDFEQGADVLIVSWASTKSAAVISNDNFNKDYQDGLIISKANNLKSKGLLLKFSFIAGEIIIPEMTAV